jgi:hypothetical protein
MNPAGPANLGGVSAKDINARLDADSRRVFLFE